MLRKLALQLHPGGREITSTLASATGADEVRRGGVTCVRDMDGTV